MRLEDGSSSWEAMTVVLLGDIYLDSEDEGKPTGVGWGWEGGSRRRGLIRVVVWQKPIQH